MSDLLTAVPRKILQDPRKASKNYLYTPDQVRELYDICENTLSNWVKRGLPCFKLGRKRLFKGEYLNAFHQKKLDESKRPAGDGEVYCFACRCNHSLLDGRLHHEVAGRAVTVWGTCPEGEYRPSKILSLAQFDALVKNRKLNPRTKKGD